MHTGAGMHTHTWTLTQRWLTEKDLERKEGRNKDRGKEWITPAQSEQYSLYQSASQPVIQPVSQINRWWSWQQLSCLMNCSHCGWAQYAMMSCRHESGGGGALQSRANKEIRKKRSWEENLFKKSERMNVEEKILRQMWSEIKSMHTVLSFTRHSCTFM